MKKETIEGNKLIAEFKCTKYFDTYYDSEGQYHFELKDAKYHSSWDWLMPVVEKIEAIDLINACVDISKNVVMVSVRDGDLIFHGNIILGKNKIETVWLAVVEFIKFYNQNNNQ